MERHPATKFLAEVSEGASFTSYRPAWADALPVPRLMLERNVRTFRRFNGRRVRPLCLRQRPPRLSGQLLTPGPRRAHLQQPGI